MDLFQAVFLSIVEGITEFLPISSTGHLILVSSLLKVPQTEFVKSFEIIIQLGAILAVVFIYRKKILLQRELWGKILAAFIPTAAVGFVLYKFIKQFLIGNEYVTLAALLVGGILLIGLEKMHSEKADHAKQISELSYKQSFLIGLVQSVSVIPGVSRSAASILGGMYLGANRKTAVEFSFLLAIPTMFAATGLDLVKSEFGFTPGEWLILGVGLAVSFVTALVVVNWFIKFVQKNTFISFGIYRIIIAVLFWISILR